LIEATIGGGFRWLGSNDMRHGFFLLQLDSLARRSPCRRREAVFPDALSPPPFFF
jgi:hypothetical protein